MLPMTEQQTTEKQEQWVLLYLAGDGQYYPVTRQKLVLVRAENKSSHGLQAAASDPANVYEVSALPGLVKATRNLRAFIDPPPLRTGHEKFWDTLDALDTALANVHITAQGDK